MMIESVIPPSVLMMLAAIARTAPDGAFVEVGVYKGGSAKILYDIARKQDSDGNLREIHLFDTFTGIPFADAVDRHQPGEFDGRNTFDFLRHVMPDAFFHVGVFPDTLPDDLCSIAFAHIDCDQYRSVSACIEHLWPRMMFGGIMWFDDMGHLEGARKAVMEFFRDEDLHWAPEGRRFVTKARSTFFQGSRR